MRRVLKNMGTVFGKIDGFEAPDYALVLKEQNFEVL